MVLEEKRASFSCNFSGKLKHKRGEDLKQRIQNMITYFRGLAKSLWPIVTKLVSWLDMNQASEETLHQTTKELLNNLYTTAN